MEYRIIETNDGEFIPQVCLLGEWYGIQKFLFFKFLLWLDERNMNDVCKYKFKRSALSAIKAHKKEMANKKLSIKRIIEVKD